MTWLLLLSVMIFLDALAIHKIVVNEFDRDRRFLQILFVLVVPIVAAIVFYFFHRSDMEGNVPVKKDSDKLKNNVFPEE